VREKRARKAEEIRVNQEYEKMQED